MWFLVLTHFRTGIDVTFHVFAPKKDERKLRSILNKWEDRGHVSNLTLSEKDSYLRSLISIQSLDINQIGIIRENDQFILSCVARGSPTITFRWFKDGTYINVTATSRKWVKLIKDPHVADQYTGLLGVERAHPYDEGIFTCQVEDFNMKECLSKEVLIEKKPSIKIEPVNLTVKKGENFTIKCVTTEESRDGSKYIYSWTKNKELLPVRTEFEKYEVLYPSGTILQVKSAEKSVQYSCLVQGSKVSSEKVVSVYVVDRKGVYTCPAGLFLEMLWPETAPDTNSILNCPKGYSGLATRYCALKDGRKPAWGLPSFSECTHHELGRIYDTFDRIKLGYSSTSLEKLFTGILNYTKKDSYTLLPGEGAKILDIIHEIMQFTSKSQRSLEQSRNITNILFSIVDQVLSTPNSLTKQEEIRTAFELVNEHLSLVGSSLVSPNNNLFRISMNTIDLTVLNLTYYHSNKYFHIPNNFDKPTTQWLGVQISGTNILVKEKNSRLAAGIIFRNISNFMPPRLFIRIKDGSELEYEIYSQIVTLLPLPEFFEMYPIAIDFKHQLNHKMNWSDDETWSVKCGYADLSTFTYSWNIYSCYTEVLSDLKTRCICPKHGIFALLLTLAPKTKTEESTSNVFFLILASITGMVLTVITTVCLSVSCFLKPKSTLTMLKLQCSFSIFLFGIIFLIAVVIGPTQSYYLLFLTGLETTILLSLSSHLSKLLIIFTELTELPKSMTSKHTVTGIISGVPVITVFASHLSYKTMDVKLESWWILKGTLSFNIFICVTSIMAVLFVFIYTIVMKKLDNLLEINEKYAKPLHKRQGLLRRSCVVFIFLILFSISSIIYINTPNILWSICQFSASNIVMGLVILVCYILKSETSINEMFEKKKTNENTFFSYNSSNSSPLKFITRQDPEVENDSTPHMKPEQFTMVNRDSTKPSIVGKSQSIAATFESCLHNMPNCDSRLDVAATSQRYKQQASLEYYNSSPQSFRKYSGAATICSPDILANKVCVELDLVASSLQRQPSRSSKVSSTAPSISPDEAIAQILDYSKDPPLSVPPAEGSYKERTQPDGHDESIICEKALSTVEEVSETEMDSPEVSEKPSPVNSDIKILVQSASVCESVKSDNLDGMLDSISQDLDYLLNKSDEVAITTLKRGSKSHASTKDTSELPESVTIRSKC
ncbi:uncharacterized protein LOC114338937 [Diabrotica virgifera virgifera]|uniref:Uncharacterized protein n=1 Tax=Diabrotica virgifera virgifera TaxID=50390 RepID=A0ABM5K5I2_DIAVI|nr:uncharacterized protein LOC114338937 [Diabrotica virgifera virgifera]